MEHVAHNRDGTPGVHGLQFPHGQWSGLTGIVVANIWSAAGWLSLAYKLPSHQALGPCDLLLQAA